MVLDGHSDLLYDVTRRRLEGERLVLERHHLDRLRRGGVEGLVLALWTTAAEEDLLERHPRNGECGGPYSCDDALYASGGGGKPLARGSAHRRWGGAARERGRYTPFCL